MPPLTSEQIGKLEKPAPIRCAGTIAQDALAIGFPAGPERLAPLVK